MAKTRVAINGFGRIGKQAFKIAFENHRDTMEIVAVNDPNPVEDALQGLKYDSIYHKFPFEVTVESGDEEGNGGMLIVDGVKIPKLRQLDPEQLPWEEMGVDIVLECTGVFRTQEGAGKHLKAGAKSVLISAPAKGGDVPTYVMGVNSDQIDAKGEGDEVFSNASCTTNCIAPVMEILTREFGVEKAMLSTIHGYTADQRLVDGTHKDPRRARAAAINIIPTSTGAAVATAAVVPEVDGIFDGMAFRVPVPVGSISDITVLLSRDVTEEEVNAALEKAAASDRYKGILEVTYDPIVSTDIIGNPHSSIADLSLTKVTGGNMVKVVAWYDNEYGYSHRLVEQAIEVGNDLNA